MSYNSDRVYKRNKTINNRYSTGGSSHQNHSRSSDNHKANDRSLLVRYNNSGYRQYLDTSPDSKYPWKFVHRRVAEKKLSREIASDEQVHHINSNKTDNRPNNLSVLNTDIHQYIHANKVESTACFRCGSTSHFATDCYAKRDVFGRHLVTQGNKTDYIESESEDESSDSEDEQANGSCFRCGRTSHYANSCYATTDIYGNRL